MTLNVTDKLAAFGGHDPSLADVRCFILADQDLSQGRCKAMASAINTIARALKKPPEAISANPVALAESRLALAMRPSDPTASPGGA